MPAALQPLSSGGIVRFALQNTQSTGLGAHEITFNQVFAQGQVPNGSQLYAVINGVSYAAQLDVKTSYADGSVKSGIITLDAPAIAAGTTLQGQLFLGSSSTAPAVDISKLPSSGYNFAVSLTLHNSDGTTPSYQLNAGTLLSQALQGGNVSYWMQGPQATEVRFDAPISGSFHVTFDVTDFADGTTRTDVQFNNDYAEQPTGGAVTYDETITQNGSVVSQYTGVTQYQYQTRHEVFWSNGAPQVNIVHDIAGLEKTGAIPGYNLAWSSSGSQTLANYATQMAGSGWGGPLPVNGVRQYMPDTGGRPDIGPTTEPSALWLITQNQTAAQYTLGWADAAGSVPWHFYDPTTGNYLSVFQYPQLWTDPRGGNGAPGGLTQQVASSTLTGWTPETAHQPDLSYVAYMLTGDRYYLDQLNAQANFSILSDWPGYRSKGVYNDIVANGGDQVRAQAWSLRQIDEAAYANPDGSAEKAYFTQVSNDNWSWLVSQLPSWTASQGEAYGQIQGVYGSNTGSMAPWQQDYFASTTIAAAEQGNQNAKTVLQWEANFLVGRFLPHTGWNQHDGTAYNLQVYNTTTNSYYQTWGDIETASQAAGLTMNGTGWANGDYAELGLSTLAGIITVLGPAEPDAMQAYAWLLTSGAPYLTADPQFQISPKLPDGNFLYSNQIQTDTSNTNVTLTATGGDSLLAVSGTGSDTLIGGTGTCDILFAGTSGNNTLKAGTGNDYMFGGFSGGTTTFVDNIGNNYMKGGTGTNIYQFSENASGHDTIANFNTTTDQLQIGANLNGNGITTASQLVSSATVSNGNTVLHLSPNDDITLLGLSDPSELTTSISLEGGEFVPWATTPSAPGKLALASTSDTGAKRDNVTSITTPEITGTGTAGDTVSLFDGSIILGTLNVRNDGTWSITTTTLTDGVHHLTAQQTDLAGNASAASDPLDLTIRAHPVYADPLSVSDLLSKPSSQTLIDLVDFDGNHLGAVSSWSIMGEVDVQGDGDLEYVLTNRDIGRWATLGPDEFGVIDLANHSWGGDTRVVGIYTDPLIKTGEVQAGSPFDSEARFQNDLRSGNINAILGAGDYNGDGLQEVYFSLTDKTAVLHAYMHADGNLQYANYQTSSQAIDYLQSHGYGHETWGTWF
jgi:Bacterial Ig-like domain